MKKIAIYFLILFSAISTIYGQEVNIRSSFDTSRIYIGDQVKYTVSIDQPSDLIISLPLLIDTLCKNIEILAGPVIDSAKVINGRVKINTQYLVTSFDSGFYQVPPVYAELKDENGIRRFYSDYSQLEVMRVKIAPADTTAKIYDIIQPYKAPVTIGEILPWILLLALGGVLIWFIVKYIKRIKQSKQGIEPLVNLDPAHIIAFRELEKLKNDQLWQKGEIKVYYTRLTEILRQYLENRYRVYSLELTTSETLEALVKSGFKKDELYKSLKNILTAADLVKFAKHNPEPIENDIHFQNSWEFVSTTKIVDVLLEVDKETNKGEGIQ